VRVVVDTNTLISGSLWQGPSARFLEAAARGKVELVLSPELLAEFAEVVSRPKFAARVAAGAATPDDLARKLAEEATIVAPIFLPLPPQLRDPGDLHVLACAVAAHADAIISGDADLLTMQSFQGIPIINASEALRQLGLESE
jgi:putative PIN family toxin of toxin-antitoxin system